MKCLVCGRTFMYPTQMANRLVANKICAACVIGYRLPPDMGAEGWYCLNHGEGAVHNWPRFERCRICDIPKQEGLLAAGTEEEAILMIEPALPSLAMRRSAARAQ